MKSRNWTPKLKIRIKDRFRKMMKCIYLREQLRADENIPSSESLVTKDYSASGFSSRTGDVDSKVDTSNIEEAESSLRESGFLNYEEARALLGRLEYQKGNIEAALHVFEGIDITTVTQKMKFSLIGSSEIHKRLSQSDWAPPMSIHTISLLFEAIFLKCKCLQTLGRLEEAAQLCKIILDTVESAFPEGLPINFAECKLQGTLNKAVELLPELYKLSFVPNEAILSYRRALLYNWNLNIETKTKIQKEFAIFLLYCGYEATPPNIRFHIEGLFVPRSNIEEAILLLVIILKNIFFEKTEWDPSIFDHLCFALSISDELNVLARVIEELPKGIFDRKQEFSSLALCYYGHGENDVALNLLRNLLKDRENNDCVFELLLASKICGENHICLEEGIGYARKAQSNFYGKCKEMEKVANFLLGVSLSAQSREICSDSERFSRQNEGIKALEKARKMSKNIDTNVLFHLSIANAEQRKLDIALNYSKEFLKLECGSSVKGWIILARILSAQKRFLDAENIINAGLDETGKWDHGELLRIKAKLQIAQGKFKNAIETYTHLLAILQVLNKSFGIQYELEKSKLSNIKNLEMETWHDLADVYTSLSQWRDAELCLAKSETLNPHSASTWHSKGLLFKAKGLHIESLKSFQQALGVDPTHVPSLISTAIVLRHLNNRSTPFIRSFLTDALRFDRTNHVAWYNLGLLYKSEGGGALAEAVECFEAAAFLEGSVPVEPFR